MERDFINLHPMTAENHYMHLFTRRLSAASGLRSDGTRHRHGAARVMGAHLQWVEFFMRSCFIRLTPARLVKVGLVPKESFVSAFYILLLTTGRAVREHSAAFKDDGFFNHSSELIDIQFPCAVREHSAGSFNENFLCDITNPELSTLITCTVREHSAGTFRRAAA